MLEPVLDVFEVVVARAQADVAFFEESNLNRVEVQHQAPLADVHFPALVQQRIFDVFLADIGVLARFDLVNYR